MRTRKLFQISVVLSLFLLTSLSQDAAAQKRVGTGRRASRIQTGSAPQPSARTQEAAGQANNPGGCAQTARTKVFDVLVKCARRAQLREAIKQTDGVPTREQDNYWCDLYNSSELLTGSSTLSVCYARDVEFALAMYKFPVFMDAGKVVEVRRMVQSKYGAATRSSGRADLGPVVYMWRQPDGMVIVVSRGWPDTTVYLEFREPSKFSAMQAEIKAQDDKEKARKFKAQGKAF